MFFTTCHEISQLPEKKLIAKLKTVSSNTVDLEQAEKAQGKGKEVKKNLLWRKDWRSGAVQSRENKTDGDSTAEKTHLYMPHRI